MDQIDEVLTRIVTKIEQSTLPDTQKADVYVQLHVGMRRLVWPILMDHIPKEMLDELVNTANFSVDTYMNLIEQSLANPATPKEIHDEIKGALEEVEGVIETFLTSQNSVS